MKYFRSILFAFFIVGLFYSLTQAQSSAETPQFHFPLEVGNVWVYRDSNFPSCGLQHYCVYERIEVVRVNRHSESTCANVEHINDWRRYDSVGNIETISYRIDDAVICQSGNRIYAFADSLSLQNGLLEKYMVADFDRNESQPWQIAFDPIGDSEFPYILRRLKGTEIDGEPEFYFGNYRAAQPTNLVGPDSYYLGNATYSVFKFDIGISRLWNSKLFAYSLSGILTGDTTFVVPTSIEHDPDYEDGPSLLSAYPNPFNPSTVVRFQLSVFGEVSVKVHDLLGREVATLVNEKMMPGQHSVTFDASGLPSGMYVIVLETNGMRDVSKVTLVK